MNQDADHLRLLSVFHYVLGGLMAFFACIPIIHLILGLVMIFAPKEFDRRNETGALFAGWMFVIMASVFIIIGWVTAALIIWSGRNLQQRRRYMFSFVMACVMCAFFPFGTALGVFTLLVLMRPSVKALFPGQSPTV